MVSSFVGVRNCKALLAAVADCDVTPPKSLTALVEAFDALGATSSGGDPMSELVKRVAAGGISSRELDKLIADAATERMVREFRTGLLQHVERPIVEEFVAVLEAGSADEIITSLSPAFDDAAATLAKCAELVDPSVDAETFLAGADTAKVAAWQDIDRHVATLAQISAVVGQLGPQSTSFPMVELPMNLPGYGVLNNNAIMCVDASLDIEAAAQIFAEHGAHRYSPFFRGASALRLNTIAEAREKVRAWAESSWQAMNLNAGRGRLDPADGFIAEPVPNPYARKETVTR